MQSSQIYLPAAFMSLCSCQVHTSENDGGGLSLKLLEGGLNWTSLWYNLARLKELAPPLTSDPRILPPSECKSFS